MAGVMLLGETDRKLGLIEAAARCIADPRSPLPIKHAVRDMLRQRVYGLALGWEDLNDHGALHGHQEGRFFHGYYDCYCYLPLYVFRGQQLLCAYLRPSRIDGAQHAAAILKLLVGRLRQKWPQVRIVFRGDSGFCRQRIINYCERAGVHYIVGLARNARLEQITQFLELAMKDAYTHTGLKQREVGDFPYAAQSWARERGDHAPGIWRAGQQPALPGDQPRGPGPGAVRRAVLPAR